MICFEPFRVLLVDIGSGHLRALEPQLQSAGLRTFIAQDYEQVLSEVRQGRFDLILMGDALVDIHSIDLPKTLRYIGSVGHLPLLWVPVKADSQIVIAGLEMGIDLVIDRSTPLPILLSYILTHAKRKRRTDELIDNLNHARSLLAEQTVKVDQLKDSNQTLQEMTMRDPMTGLFNRRYLQSWMAQAFAFAERHQKPLSVIFLDLDHFKWINDCYGHLSGDNALKFLAAVLKNSVRDSDLVARYAGDEFLIALPDTPADQLPVLAERVLKHLKDTPLTSGGDEFHISCSMGSATFPEVTPVATCEELLHLADQSLYAAKRAGRGQLAQWHHLGPEHHEACCRNPVLAVDDN